MGHSIFAAIGRTAEFVIQWLVADGPTRQHPYESFEPGTQPRSTRVGAKQRPVHNHGVVPLRSATRIFTSQVARRIRPDLRFLPGQIETGYCASHHAALGTHRGELNSQCRQGSPERSRVEGRIAIACMEVVRRQRAVRGFSRGQVTTRLPCIGLKESNGRFNWKRSFEGGSSNVLVGKSHLPDFG